jgi:hypothetical protein
MAKLFSVCDEIKRKITFYQEANMFLSMRLCVAALIAGILLVEPVMGANPDPYLKPNNTWISISGTVESVSRDAFILDYGDGSVIVEMDDGDRDADAYKLVSGDKVTVNGMIDDDFFETTSIEAGSVYVEKLGTYFNASAVDDEDLNYVVWYTVPVVIGATAIEGTVSDVGKDYFIVNTGPRSINVRVDDMPDNPLDKEGYQRIAKGDYVRAIGVMEDDLFQNNKLDAISVVTLANR